MQGTINVSELETTMVGIDDDGDIGVIQDNNASIKQGGNTATGGAANATGGAGGDADSGNTQTDNGIATATARRATIRSCSAAT